MRWHTINSGLPIWDQPVRMAASWYWRVGTNTTQKVVKHSHWIHLLCDKNSIDMGNFWMSHAKYQGVFESNVLYYQDLLHTIIKTTAIGYLTLGKWLWQLDFFSTQFSKSFSGFPNSCIMLLDMWTEVTINLYSKLKGGGGVRST